MSNAISANYVALQQLAARLGGLAQSFSRIPMLPAVSASEAGDGGLAAVYEDFRTSWGANRQAILEELDAAMQIVDGALATYQTADASVAGTGGD